MHYFDYNDDYFGVGTIDAPEWRIDDRTRAYAMRAAAARAGLWGNHGYEANYEFVYVDADGEQLNGTHRYELRLEAMPPVDAFWSLTMYASRSSCSFRTRSTATRSATAPPTFKSPRTAR
jgi:hypothetical protein